MEQKIWLTQLLKEQKILQTKQVKVYQMLVKLSVEQFLEQ
jgi:hypothetical protein